MHPALIALVADLEALANPAQAEKMAAYMKNNFPFLGIPKPQLAAAIKPHMAALGNVSYAEMREIVLYLWDKEAREFQYVAMEVLWKNKRRWSENVLELIEDLILRRSWWDSVDMLAGTYAGFALQKWSAQRPLIIEQWRNSDNMWLVRSSLLFQLKYKEQTDAALLFSIIQQHAGAKQFFIQKAIGWVLRQYAYTQPDMVRAFVAENSLAPLSRREAMKHLG